jgi:hypothetical protein
MHRNTGAVHFTVTANIVTDDFVPPSDWDNVAAHLKWIGLGASVLAGPFTGLWATAASLTVKAAGTICYFGGVATTLAEIKAAQSSFYSLSVPGWTGGKDHIMALYHGAETLKIYSYRNDDCWPNGCYDETKTR